MASWTCWEGVSRLERRRWTTAFTCGEREGGRERGREGEGREDREGGKQGGGSGGEKEGESREEEREGGKEKETRSYNPTHPGLYTHTHERGHVYTTKTAASAI